MVYDKKTGPKTGQPEFVRALNNKGLSGYIYRWGIKYAIEIKSDSNNPQDLNDVVSKEQIIPVNSNDIFTIAQQRAGKTFEPMYAINPATQLPFENSDAHTIGVPIATTAALSRTTGRTKAVADMIQELKKNNGGSAELLQYYIFYDLRTGTKQIQQLNDSDEIPISKSGFRIVKKIDMNTNPFQIVVTKVGFAITRSDVVITQAGTVEGGQPDPIGIK